MKTEIRIPKMDAVIMCHNKRELFAAQILIDNMEYLADSAVKGYAFADAVADEFGAGSYHFAEMYGKAGFMYHAGMLKEPISSVEFHKACRAMYLEKIGLDI